MCNLAISEDSSSDGTPKRNGSSARILKRQVTHVVLVSGDGDLLSAVELAQSEGVVVWLAHGPSNTCSSELWSAVDNRIALDAPFLQRIARDW